MFSLNRATLIGNITRDPEVRQTTSGQNVCSFSVATNRAWTDTAGQKQEQTEFHSVVAWGKLADICKQFLTKGRKVYIEGRLQTRDWQGQDGVKRYRTEIVAENMILLDKAGSGSGASAGAAGGSSESSGGFSRPSSNNQEESIDPDQEIRIEDIPF